MKKEFIPYEEALALKELGFNEPCFRQSEHKKECSSKVYGYCPLPNVHCNFPDCEIDKSVTPVGLPLWQQAFRWFRSNHGLFGRPDIGNQEYCFKIFDEASDNHILDGLPPLGNSFNGSFEEANLACLRALIKIVKDR